MDHAAYGVEILFHEGLIRHFLDEDQWDDIIRTAIAKHSDFILKGVSDPRSLLHAKLIRDADKLDNFRVKLEDDFMTFMGITEEETGALKISPVIYETVFRNSTILSSDRTTKMDYWVSYIVHIFDLNFRESMDIVARKQLHRTSDPESSLFRSGYRPENAGDTETYGKVCREIQETPLL